MTDMIEFIVEFALAGAVAVAIERLGSWIGGLRSGGSGGRGGDMAPWRHGPMPPHPGPHGGATGRTARRGPRRRAATRAR